MCRRQKRRPPPERGRRFINSLQGSLVGTALSRRRILKSLFMPSGTNRPRLLPGTPWEPTPTPRPTPAATPTPRLPPHRRRRLPSPDARAETETLTIRAAGARAGCAGRYPGSAGASRGSAPDRQRAAIGCPGTGRCGPEHVCGPVCGRNPAAQEREKRRLNGP